MGSPTSASAWSRTRWTSTASARGLLSPLARSEALVFSNAAGPGQAHLPAIQKACAAAGIELETVGASAGKSLARPAKALGEFDLIFAKAKAALEAMSVARGRYPLRCGGRGAAW